jgi:hypothetical protein
MSGNDDEGRTEELTCLEQSVAVGHPAVCDRVQGSPQSYMYEMMQSLGRLGAPAATNPSAACCLLSERAYWGRWGAVHCALVEGGRKSACSHALHKRAEVTRVVRRYCQALVQTSIKNALLS